MIEEIIEKKQQQANRGGQAGKIHDGTSQIRIATLAASQLLKELQQLPQ